jgi:hypothetical protein
MSISFLCSGGICQLCEALSGHSGLRAYQFLIKKAKKNELRKKIAHLIVFFVPLSQGYGNTAGFEGICF